MPFFFTFVTFNYSRTLLHNTFDASFKKYSVMSKIHKLFIAVTICLVMQAASAQGWSKITSLPDIEFSVLEVIDGTIYTAAGKTIYTSADNGATWTNSNFTSQEDVRVSCFTKFNDKVYAGTSNGIFSSDITSVHSPWYQDLQTEEITSFTERDNVLYASLEVYGVLKLVSPTTWVTFNTGLPSYSQSVTEVLSTPAGLLAIAGANGTFYRYDFNLNTWIEDYYINNGIIPGLDIDDIATIGNSLYISRYNNIYRSDDMGENWVEDNDGLLTGQTRTIYATQNDLYSISVIGNDTTRLHKRGVNDIGGTWADDVEVLPFFSNAMHDLNGDLFIAALDGIYTTSTILGIPENLKLTTLVYPNPSADGHFMIKSNTTIESIKVYDLTGRIVAEEQYNNGLSAFTISLAGIYIVELKAGSASIIQKVLVQ